MLAGTQVVPLDLAISPVSFSKEPIPLKECGIGQAYMYYGHGGSVYNPETWYIVTDESGNDAYDTTTVVHLHDGEIEYRVPDTVVIPIDLGIKYMAVAKEV